MRRPVPHILASLSPLLLLTVTTAAWATEAPLTGGAGSFSLATAILKAIGALLLILGLMLLMAKLFRKLGTGLGAMGQGAMINILETRMLGPKKQVSVIEVGGEVLVVGVTDQQITLISRLDDPSRLLRPAAPLAARPAANGRIRRDSGFAALLDRALRPAPKKAKEEGHDPA
ncbi:MAG TPA: flagellar biosynthetic protein FliO [Desulfurivibrionaceae bacterium]|nr:flagellar biosynthetic protein FliO [Desulfurivibrionaceae bacterium]